MARWRLRAGHRHRHVEVFEVGSIAELRRLRARLVADPDIEWIDPSASRVPEIPILTICPRCGRRYTGHTNDIAVVACRCGIVHVRRRCDGVGCWSVTVTPPAHEGCGELPHDQQAAADRYRTGRRRWRPAHPRLIRRIARPRTPPPIP